MSGRPHRINAPLAAKIDDLASKGLTASAILRVIHSAGETLNRRTLAKYLAEHPPARPARPALASAHAEAPPAPDLTSLEQDAAGALEADDLPRLARAAATAERLTLTWGERAAFDPVAARTWATVSRVHSDLRARLVELRPRPEVEADRLSEIAGPRRRALIERAHSVASANWQGQAQRLREMLDAVDADAERAE